MKVKEKEYLFVDGYNIINAWGRLKKLSKISLEVAREKLIEIMAEYQSFTGIKVIIVFDAHLVKGNMRTREKRYDVDVVYTQERETADQYIEKQLDALGRRKRVRVATSDWVEQQIVLGRGGTRISARELEIELDIVKKNIERKTLRKKEQNEVRGVLGEQLDKNILEKLEKIRRNME